MAKETPLIPIIDLFAGPGGLGEGFSAFEESGKRRFRIALSVEKDRCAHETLRLRSFFRQFPKGDAPDIYYQILKQEVNLRDLPREVEKDLRLVSAWQRASEEAVCAELGPATHLEIRTRITDVLKSYRQPWVLIGGPPCQAYSLAGRVRNKGIENYTIETDKRSKLYEEYLRIIAEHRPTIFVMENVTGLLSATVEKKKIFEKILSDLARPDGIDSKLRYRVVPIVTATDPEKQYKEEDPRRFIVRCEEYGVPQQRHRVILIGVLDSLKDIAPPPLLRAAAPSVFSVIGSLPRLRSGLSRSRDGNEYLKMKDDAESWLNTVQRQIGVKDYAPPAWVDTLDARIKERLIASANQMTRPQKGRGAEFVPVSGALVTAQSLRHFLIDERLNGVCNHSTRSHLDTDLARYMFCATFGEIRGRSPRLEEFPRELLPTHKNASSGHFDDRFRVQVADKPATTITSHISKDGHYFIHFDPTQCRSLTVREAARLQTFPDNYYFCGPRTQQYTQVGNAVPPWIAKQIAESIFKTLVNAGEVT